MRDRQLKNSYADQDTLKIDKMGFTFNKVPLSIHKLLLLMLHCLDPIRYQQQIWRQHMNFSKHFRVYVFMSVCMYISIYVFMNYNKKKMMMKMMVYMLLHRKDDIVKNLKTEMERKTTVRIFKATNWIDCTWEDLDKAMKVKP